MLAHDAYELRTTVVGLRVAAEGSVPVDLSLNIQLRASLLTHPAYPSLSLSKLTTFTFSSFILSSLSQSMHTLNLCIPLPIPLQPCPSSPAYPSPPVPLSFPIPLFPFPSFLA